MPLFYQHNINGTTKLGVWLIEEPESFFLQKVPFKADVSHPHKRIQHLAGRYLLPTLFGDFPLDEISIADTRKPFLANERYHFSISHSGRFAAALVSSKHRVGIDIELMTERIIPIAKKFLNEPEIKYFEQRQQVSEKQGGDAQVTKIEFLTLIWSSKEAIFKWYGEGEVDFRKHIRLEPPLPSPGLKMEFHFLFRKQENIPVEVQAMLFDDLVLAYLVT